MCIFPRYSCIITAHWQLLLLKHVGVILPPQAVRPRANSIEHRWCMLDMLQTVTPWLSWIASVLVDDHKGFIDVLVSSPHRLPACSYDWVLLSWPSHLLSTDAHLGMPGMLDCVTVEASCWRLILRRPPNGSHNAEGKLVASLSCHALVTTTIAQPWLCKTRNCSMVV